MLDKTRRFFNRHRYLAIELIVMCAIGIAVGFAAIFEADFMALNRGGAVKSTERDTVVTQAGAPRGASIYYNSASLHHQDDFRTSLKRGAGLYDGP